MRKEQMFDWNCRYYKNCWERLKKIQKLLRLCPKLKSFPLSERSGNLHISGFNLKDLHTIRTCLKEKIKWEDKIYYKDALSDSFLVTYKGNLPYDFLYIDIDFPCGEIPKGILGDCHIETEQTKIKAYVHIQKRIVCPLGE